MAIYGRILRVPGVAVLIAATTLTRLPFAINGLAVILFMRDATGSFATAGLVAGSLALGAGMGAPFAARLVDRRGAVWLLPLAIVHGAAILALWGLGEIDAAAVALVAAALVAGASFPPSGAVLRSRWPELLAGDPELVRGAYAFDSVTIEISFVSGPLITGALVALAEPQAAMALSSVLVVAGTLLFLSRLPDARRALPASEHTAGLGPLRSPAIRLIALTSVPVGFCIGSVEVVIPAFSEEAGNAALAGVLLSVWSLASGIGGLIFGARQSRRELLDSFLLIGRPLPAGHASDGGRRRARSDGAVRRDVRRSDRAADRHQERADLAGRTGGDRHRGVYVVDDRSDRGTVPGNGRRGRRGGVERVGRGRPDRRGGRRRRRDHDIRPARRPCGPRWPRPEPRLAVMDVELLERTLAERGEPSYRAGQVWEWAARGAGGYDEMTNLPAALRTELNEAVPYSTFAARAGGTVEGRDRQGALQHRGRPRRSRRS